MVVDKISQAFESFKLRLADGLTWEEIIATVLEFIVLVSEIVKELKASNVEKKQLVVEWALLAYDAAVTAITTPVSAWWLIPIFAAIRILLVQFMPGIVEFLYQRIVKPRS